MARKRAARWLAATALTGALLGTTSTAGATQPWGDDQGRSNNQGRGNDYGRGDHRNRCQGGDLYALTRAGKLSTVNRWDAGRKSCTLQVGNYQGFPVGLDVRPANGALYMVTNDNGVGRIYTVDPSTGWATFVSQIAVGLRGTNFGVDFNPVADRLRVVSDAEQNLRINVDTGATTGTPAGNAEDTPLAYAAGDANAGRNPGVTGAAYTNSFAPSPRTEPTTTLYDLDSDLDVLTTQAPPNDGTLNTRGSLGVDAQAVNGFDIDGRSNEAYAALQVGDRQSVRLYQIDLSSGRAEDRGRIGSGDPIVGLTFAIR